MKAIYALFLAGALMAQNDEIPVFRAEVSLIKVDVQVTDRGNRSLSDLTPRDFIVMDENEPQKIVHFAKESDPLDLLLLLDVSGSMRRSLEEVAATTRASLAQLRPGDRVGLMLFSRRAEVALPFTTDFQAVQTRIVDSIYKQNLGAGTLINEALLAASKYVQEQPVKGRRAILLVTDNEGINFEVSSDRAVRALYAANIVLNAIVVRPPAASTVPDRKLYSNPDSAAPDVFKLSQRTGGEAVEDAGKIRMVFQRLIEGIQARYSVHYSGPHAEAGAFRHIRVDLTPEARHRHPDAVIRAREGYYATP